MTKLCEFAGFCQATGITFLGMRDPKPDPFSHCQQLRGLGQSAILGLGQAPGRFWESRVPRTSFRCPPRSTFIGQSTQVLVCAGDVKLLSKQVSKEL